MAPGKTEADGAHTSVMKLGVGRIGRDPSYVLAPPRVLLTRPLISSSEGSPPTNTAPASGTPGCITQKHRLCRINGITCRCWNSCTT